jgi:formylglycine-generating enzyme required for sulfatase activity/serine/threonine protein phosphatase PrpC
MALVFELAGSQIDGARDYQEDAFLITHLTDANGNPSALIVVADGMGGHAAGNVASNMAVQAFNKHVSANYPADSVAEILEQAVVKANNSIKETVSETPALEGMGCTMVAAILEEGKITWASVGDSHLYLVRERELTKKNADHSYGGFLDRMEKEGTPVEPEPGLSRNMLMSAITGEDINEIDVNQEPFQLEAGDRVILCSDGLDTLSSGKIIQYSEWSDSPKECADALMQAVEDANMPRQDNTTAVVVNVKDAAGESASAAPAEEAKEEIGEATAEMEVVSDTADSTPTPEPEPAPAPPPQAEPAMDTASSESKSKAGLFIGIAAVLVIVIGAGIFFAMGGKDKAAPTGELIAEESGMAEEAMDMADEAVATLTEEMEETTSAVEEKVEETIATVEKEVVAAAPAPASKSMQPGSTFTDKLSSGGNGPTMVVIPAGTFKMGSSSSRYSEENPRHDVKAEKFAVSQKEITFAEYEKFAAATNRKIPDNLYMEKESHPVIFVSWDDAYYYTKWLSEQTGEKYRLLSEAEWEYMANTGKKTTFWWGYDEEPNRAHCFGCGTGLDPRKPTKVGSFGPNDFGIHDTSGNVAEWVRDCWHDNYKGAPSYAEVWEGGDCAYRVVRGGAYSTPPQSIRSAKRDKFKSDEKYDHIGIRVARDIR